MHAPHHSQRVMGGTVVTNPPRPRDISGLIHLLQPAAAPGYDTLGSRPVEALLAPTLMLDRPGPPCDS
jgi:hypothetical protein